MKKADELVIEVLADMVDQTERERHAAADRAREAMRKAAAEGDGQALHAATMAWLDTMRDETGRLGEITREMPKHPQSRGGSGSADTTPTKTGQLAKIGVQKQAASDAERIAANPSRTRAIRVAMARKAKARRDGEGTAEAMRRMRET